MNSKIARTFRNNYYESLSSSCRAVCLHKGYHKNDIISTISSQIYSGDMQKWIQQCQSAEFGVVSQHINILNIKAYNVDGTSDSTTLSPADGILWSTTILGTKFDIFDSITNTKLYSVTVSYNQILVVGETPTRPKHQIENLLFHVNNTLQSFFTKPQIVKRTFSELGFKKDKIPDYIWHSIYAFYYNNINNAIREDRENNNYVLNWWESELNLIHIPPVLSTYWHTELRKVAEKWIGGLVPLKNSIIYGLREYTNGARLLTHTDRESTHGIAIIINIAQIDVEKPWYVEMYDFANRLHKVDMEPGDIILYEAMKCLHGRMEPLVGRKYINLFAHYMPLNEGSRWYSKSNPPTAPQPLLELHNCTYYSKGNDSKEKGTYCNNVLHLPYLSQNNEVLHSGNDLFDYWLQTGDHKSDTSNNNGVNGDTGKDQRHGDSNDPQLDIKISLDSTLYDEIALSELLLENNEL